ncbi:uncharacterized protein LOC111045326 [Nilaparvata lugens]|uniref:uncharacterized protein LOC111045326 n=1 Tax=Nilaparvata lugens TaxID=108931 RepID=UPI00193E94A5|nr:uncharacterized protein LOC111045326 [Nilaparvata lugens]XP_039283309.1 uncharacterized protein LOC111045326 [Nilaparvata lugens]
MEKLNKDLDFSLYSSTLRPLVILMKFTGGISLRNVFCHHAYDLKPSRGISIGTVLLLLLNVFVYYHFGDDIPMPAIVFNLVCSILGCAHFFNCNLTDNTLLKALVAIEDFDIQLKLNSYYTKTPWKKYKIYCWILILMSLGILRMAKTAYHRYRANDIDFLAQYLLNILMEILWNIDVNTLYLLICYEISLRFADMKNVTMKFKYGMKARGNCQLMARNLEELRILHGQLCLATKHFYDAFLQRIMLFILLRTFIILHHCNVLLFTSNPAKHKKMFLDVSLMLINIYVLTSSTGYFLNENRAVMFLVRNMDAEDHCPELRNQIFFYEAEANYLKKRIFERKTFKLDRDTFSGIVSLLVTLLIVSIQLPSVVENWASFFDMRFRISGDNYLNSTFSNTTAI